MPLTGVYAAVFRHSAEYRRRTRAYAGELVARLAGGDVTIRVGAAAADAGMVVCKHPLGLVAMQMCAHVTAAL